MFFLNYLCMLEEEDEGSSWRLERLADHRDRVVEQLRAAVDPRVQDKLSWLARYHNSYCRRSVARPTNLPVPEDLLGAGITLLGDHLEELRKEREEARQGGPTPPGS